MKVGIGFLEPLYVALMWVVTNIHSLLSNVLDPDSGAAWALSIVLLTVAMRLLLFPLFVKQIQSSRKMQALQPKMKELQRKYKNDRQRLNQEMMKLYQENNANPLGGCLPLLVSLPIFYGLFTVLRNISLENVIPEWGLTRAVVQSASEARVFGAAIAGRFLNTSFLPGSTADQFIEVAQSSTSAKVVAIVLMLVSTTTMFLTMRHSMQRSTSMQSSADNPAANMQKMMLFLVPLFGVFTLWLPIGVLIYIVTTNVWTLGQNYFIYWKYPASEGPATASSGGAAGAAGSDGSGPAPAPSSDGSGGGVLGRRGRTGPAETPPTPPARTVRQQPVNRPKSKRSGGRKR